MDEDEAASLIQGLYRSRKAREMVKQLALLAFERVYDESTGFYFYFNRQTGESSWEAPKLAGMNAYTPRSRKRFQAQEMKRKEGTLKNHASMTKDEAARSIQGLYRNRKARQYLYTLLNSIYEKGYDEEGNVFYYNHKTGESSWSKPVLLGSQDLDYFEEIEVEPEGKVDPDEFAMRCLIQANKTKAEGELQLVRDFLGQHKLLELLERLVEEGFEDMASISAMQEEDIEELGLKRKFRAPLREAVSQYRKDTGISDPFEEQHSEYSEDAEEAECKSSDDEINEDDENKEVDVSDSESDQDEDDSVADLDEIPGVEIQTIFEGDGKHFPKKGQFALVHYVASFEDGTVFESSRKRGSPLDFMVGAHHVIPGWDKGVRKLSRGQRALLIIAPHMGYGSVGRPPVVPPNATLRFEVELIDTHYSPVGELLDDSSEGDMSDSDDER